VLSSHHGSGKRHIKKYLYHGVDAMIEASSQRDELAEISTYINLRKSRKTSWERWNLICL
jgi:hypothetical protein